jgi:hypothetical protein
MFSADGAFVKPGIVIHCKTYDQEIETLGLASDKVDIYSQDHGHVDRVRFKDRFESTFTP